MEKLVFLHIEKSAGSAQRALLYESVGKKNVFWYGINSHSNTFIPEEVDFSCFIGGHRRYSFYQIDKYGYLAVVREPFDRVVSLFNYLKNKELESWLGRGLDPDSLKNTVFNSRAFREMINDAQCDYISGSKSFEKTIEHVNKNKYLVGTLDNIGSFNNCLVGNVELISGLLQPDNVGQAGYKKEIQLDDETRGEIEKLVWQDIQLYNYLILRGGMLNTIKRDEWLTFNEAVSQKAKQPSLLVSVRDMTLSRNHLSLIIEVINLSEESLNLAGHFAGVRVFDAKGECFREGRAKLDETCEPMSKRFFNIELADFNAEMAKTFRFGVVNTIEKRWLEKDEVEAPIINFNFMNT